MAKTRAEIAALVVLNTGRSDKTSLINSQCDNALKVAVTEHPFQDSLHICDDLTIDEDATSVDISTLTESSVSVGTVIDIITARIVEADGSRNKILKLKNKQWWDKNIVNPEDNQKGWPRFGLKFGSKIILECPAMSGLELRLRVSSVPTFAGDDVECPIGILDVFVEQYVTAMVYLSLGMTDKYLSWYIMALGRDYDRGRVGGTLLQCKQKDRSESAEDKVVERDMSTAKERGVSVKNLITGHDRCGEIDTWY